MDGREGTPARGPVGIPADGPVGMVDVVVDNDDVAAGPDGMDGEGVCVGRLAGVLMRGEISAGMVRGGAAPQEPDSERWGRSLLNEPLPPRINPPLPRLGGTKPRGPEGGIIGPELSDLLWPDMELGDGEGAVKFRLLLGPVGALKPAGPRGGDLGAIGRTGDRSLGVDLAESLAGSLSL